MLHHNIQYSWVTTVLTLFRVPVAMVRTEIVLDATKVVMAVILVMPMGIACNRVDDCAEALFLLLLYKSAGGEPQSRCVRRTEHARIVFQLFLSVITPRYRKCIEKRLQASCGIVRAAIHCNIHISVEGLY
jgi:hypothetical protein